MQVHMVIDIFHKGFRKIGNMDESTFFDADIYEAAKIGDVVHDTW